jgi:membrane-bound inhibitor of C-type lysozyme
MDTKKFSAPTLVIIFLSVFCIAYIAYNRTPKLSPEVQKQVDKVLVENELTLPCENDKFFTISLDPYNGDTIGVTLDDGRSFYMSDISNNGSKYQNETGSLILYLRGVKIYLTENDVTTHKNCDFEKSGISPKLELN